MKRFGFRELIEVNRCMLGEKRQCIEASGDVSEQLNGLIVQDMKMQRRDVTLNLPERGCREKSDRADRGKEDGLAFS